MHPLSDPGIVIAAVTVSLLMVVYVIDALLTVTGDRTDRRLAEFAERRELRREKRRAETRARTRTDGNPAPEGRP